jgi:hypothetical protein
MSAQNGGPNETSEAGSKPDIGSRPDSLKPKPGPDAPFAGLTQDEPVVDADAREAREVQGDRPVDPHAPVEVSPESPAHLGEPVEEPVIASEAGESLQTEAAAESSAEEDEEFVEQDHILKPAAVKPRIGGSMILLAGVAVLGLGYLGWTQFVAQPETPEPVAPPAPVVEPPRHAEARRDVAPTPPIPAEASKGERQSASPAPQTKAAEAPSSEATLLAKLAATQAALERATQKLQALEGQAAAPKSDARAAAEVGSARAGDASARIVVAQSLLTALRQGDDFTAQVTALQGFDGDSPRILSLRAALNSPSAAKLAADFAALEPKLARAAAPKSAKSAQEDKPKEARTAPNYGETVLAFIEARVDKLVKISPADEPDNEQTGERLKRIEQKLLRGDIAGALAERSLLPEPAILLSADWAKGAQARLEAEMAAKAELAEAMEAFGRNKS